MVSKCSAVCLVALAVLAGLCDAQYYQKPATPPKRPQQQEKQTFEKPITWKFPEEPNPPPKPEGPSEVREPVPANTVAVDCREQSVHVEVKKDMFNIGQYIHPADLTLGNCAVTAEDPTAQVLIFEAALQDCGSVLMMTDTSVIYTYTVNYDPQPLFTSPVVRTSKAAVIVECHYQRRHNVSSLPLDPVWVPYAAVKMAEDFLYFSLTLMTADFVHARPSYQYYLGNIINVEASVYQYHHVPLRVFVDYCIATMSPDPSSNPKYAFIEQGCMLDGRLTGSASQFMARTSEDKLQFQLEAFRFKGAESGLLYITCHLRAVSAAMGIDTSHRACSYVNGWKEASGFNSMCGSCEPTDVPLPSYPAVVSTGVSGGGGGGSSTGSGTGSGTWGGGGGGGGSTGSGTGSGTWGGGSSHTRKSRKAPENSVAFEGTVVLGPFSIEESVTV